MTDDPKTARERVEDFITRKAAEDENIRAELKKNPRAAVAKVGIALPEGIESRWSRSRRP
ncbi:MAG: hypothetical protein EHM61_00255 [Acidobacteria bacterium]|nr:MAG: hypothetical protein EHM61_00255 [Acidobacteriota bacterium]